MTNGENRNDSNARSKVASDTSGHVKTTKPTTRGKSGAELSKLNAKRTDKASAGQKGKSDLSFDKLRQEHDMLILMRTTLLIIAAIVLMVPIPFQLLGMKFIIFVVLAYASIYNEKSINEEAMLRKDRFSRNAHAFSLFAFAVVTVLFFILALKAGVNANSAVQALNQMMDQMKAAGLDPIIVK